MFSCPLSVLLPTTVRDKERNHYNVPFKQKWKLSSTKRFAAVLLWYNGDQNLNQMTPTAGFFSTHAAVFSSTNVHLCFLRSSRVWFSFSSRDTALVMSASENKLKALTLCSGKCTRGHTCKDWYHFQVTSF